MTKLKRGLAVACVLLGVAGSARSDQGVAFVAEHPDFGREPWLYFDGEARFLGDLAPGTDLGDDLLAPTIFSKLGDRIYFVADDARHGIELWEFRDDPEGPVLANELLSGLDPILPGPITELGEEGIFLARAGGARGTHFTQIWSIEGLKRRCLYDCFARSAEQIYGPFPDGDRLLFVETRILKHSSLPFGDGETEWTLFSYDGAGFSILAEGRTEGTVPTRIIPFDGSPHLFLTNTGSNQPALYRLEGSSLEWVIDVPTVGHAVAAGSDLYSLGNASTLSWRYDGTRLSPLSGSLFDWDREPFMGSQFEVLRVIAQGDAVLARHDNEIYRIRDGESTLAAEYTALRAYGPFKLINGEVHCYGELDTHPAPGSRGIFRLDPAGPVLAMELSAMIGNDYYFDGEGTVLYSEGCDLVVERPGAITRYPITDSQIVSEPANGSAPGRGINYKGWYYFPAETPTYGCELWRTNGATVEQVADLYPGGLGSDPTDFTIYDDILYFRGERSRLLYRHDGMTTTQWDGGSDQDDEPVWRRVDDIVVLDEFLFVGDADARKHWSWDGTNPPVDLGLHTLIVRGWYDGHYYALAREDGDEHSGSELWRLRDGTFEIVADLVPGSDSSAPADMIVFQDKLYFSAFNGAEGPRVLWVYDGESAQEVDPDGPANSPAQLTVVDGFLYFLASSDAHGLELWVLQDAAVRLVEDLTPGPDSSHFGSLVRCDDTLLFPAFTPEHGYELRSCADGEEVALVADIWPGLGSSYPTIELTTGDDCYFAANSPTQGRLLYQYGRGKLTRRSVGNDLPRSPDYLASSDGTHFFAATGEAGRELYRLPPNKPLELLRDLNRGSAHSSPVILGGIGNRMICSAKSEQFGRELAIVTPTTASPSATSCEVIWHDLAPGNEELYPRNNTSVRTFVGMPDALYFLTGDYLYRYDGKSSREVEIDPALGPVESITTLVRLGNRLYSAVTIDGGTSLLLEVTGLTAQLVPGPDRIVPEPEFHQLGTQWIFRGYDFQSTSGKPWVLENGVASPIATSFPAVNPELFTPHGGWIYFRALMEPDYLLYRTDGHAIEEVDLGPNRALSSDQSVFVAAGENFYVLAPTGAGPSVLCLTLAGLRTPVNSPASLQNVRELTAVNDNLYFIARLDHLSPDELYLASPVAVTRLNTTSPAELTAAGQGLYFSSRTSDGRELYHHVSGPDAQQIPSTFSEPWSTLPTDLFWANGRLYLNASKNVDVGVPFRIDATFELSPPDTYRELYPSGTDWFLESNGSIIFEAGREARILLPDGSILVPDVALSDDRDFWYPFQQGMVTTGTRDHSETELYYVDGMGVRMLAETLPGPLSSNPSQIAVVDLDPIAFLHPFEQWLASVGLPIGGTPSDWANLSDDAGTPLLLRYALGLGLHDPLSPIVPQQMRPEQAITITFRVPQEAVPGVILIVETTKTLADCDWEPLATRGPSGLWVRELGLITFALEDLRQIVSITLPREPDSGRYFRLRVEVTH